MDDFLNQDPLSRLTRDWPQRHEPFPDDFATDAKALRNWLDHLPLANPAATSRRLLDALISMNRLHIDPQQRLDALETLRAPVQQVVAALDAQVLMDSLPLPPARLQLARMAQDFEREIALGYTEALHDFCSPGGKIPFLKSKAVATCALRAVQHSGQLLAKAYSLYQTPPAGVWLRLHDLYAISHQLRIDDKAVADPLLGGAEFTTRNAYAHALLLALSNPYRYNRREMIEVFGLTRAWAPYCVLADGEGPRQAIAVRTDLDQGLGYVPEEREAASVGLLSFDPHPVQHMVAGHIRLLPPGMDLLTFRIKGGPAIQTRKAVVDSLMRGWGGSAERGHARLTAGHELDTVVGLHALHHMLAGDEDFDTFLSDIRGRVINLSAREMVAPWAGHNGAKPPVQRAKVLNQSLGGYRLIWDQGDVQRAKVGELVGLAPAADDDEVQDWMVGVIRWIRIDAAGALDAGVELLALRAQPVGIASFDEKDTPLPPMRGLLLLDQDDGDAFTVITHVLFDQRAQQLELTRPPDPLDWQGEAMIVRMNRISASMTSGAYQCLVIGNQPEQGRSGDFLPPDSINKERISATG